jgi:hypothetical protein
MGQQETQDGAATVFGSAVSGIRRANTARATAATAPTARKAARRRPLGRGDGALSQVVAPGASHDVGDHQRREGTENPRANAIENLDANQPETIVGEGIRRRPGKGDAGKNIAAADFSLQLQSCKSQTQSDRLVALSDSVLGNCFNSHTVEP